MSDTSQQLHPTEGAAKAGLRAAINVLPNIDTQAVIGNAKASLNSVQTNIKSIVKNGYDGIAKAIMAPYHNEGCQPPAWLSWVDKQLEGKHFQATLKLDMGAGNHVNHHVPGEYHISESDSSISRNWYANTCFRVRCRNRNGEECGIRRYR
jgi:hypothetical protein